MIGVVLLIVGGCAVLDGGSPVETPPDTLPGVEAADVYRLFHMGICAWRERDQYRETGWDLDYFGNAETNTLGVAIIENHVLYIVFRGSQAPKNRTDLRLNFRFYKTPIPFAPGSGMKAHNGFLRKYLGVRDEVLKRVRESGDLDVVVAGHSAGGAVASLAFADIAQSFPDRKASAVTFGMPRVFNRRAATWVDSRSQPFLRIVNGWDRIPHVPPALIGFRHVGDRVNIGGRRPLRIFSLGSEDHWPGYVKRLEVYLRRSGVSPSDIGL